MKKPRANGAESMLSKMTNHEHSAEQIISRPSRVKAQTTREWVYEYSQGDKVWPAVWGDPPEGYNSVPYGFDPMFKSASKQKVKAKSRFRIRL